MSKEVTKITKEELDKVQGFTKVSNDIVYQIGVAAVRKDGLTKDHPIYNVLQLTNPTGI